MLVAGALRHVLSLQLELAVSQKHTDPLEFLTQAASKVIAEHVVFVTHPPPVFVIQLFPVK